METFKYLFWGLEGHRRLVPLMWFAYLCAAVALILLVVPATRRKENTLIAGCVLVVASTWIDKGMVWLSAALSPILSRGF